MPNYQWAMGNGDIVEADYDRTTDTLSNEQVQAELQAAFSQYGHVINCQEVNDDLKEVFLISFEGGSENPVTVCAKGTTPGGRSNLNDEQRIQQKSKYINYAYQKHQQGEQAVQLGIYKRDGQTVFCAWLVKQSSAAAETPISKQIKITTIAQAMKEGFVQQDKGSGEYACAFRKEFIYFYIRNASWLHGSLVTELAEHMTPLPEESTENNPDEQKVEFKTGLETKFYRNRILFGAPGTGKSYTLNKERKELLGNDNDIDYERVTFHPDYSYANFVGTYKPVMVKAENWVAKSTGKENVLTILLDESKTAQEKYDLLYDTFKDGDLTRLPLLLGLYNDDSFTTRKKDGTTAVGDNSVERNHGKAIRPYVNLIDENISANEISYEYVPGPFMRVYVEALKNARTDNPKPFLLIIEEINRANVAAVFGDIFQLLDRGDDEVSEYPIQASEDIKKYLARELGGEPEQYNKIKIPDNMFIWATMNSADQGVFPMDTAFKRRWDFTYLGIDDSEKDLVGKTVVLGEGKTKHQVEWNKLRKAINKFLAKNKINEDKQLGPYFISKKIVVPSSGNEIERDAFINTFKHKVIMYLFEDAAKQKRSTLFEGCFDSSSRYSEICKEFDLKGIGIFNSEIQNAAEPIDLLDAVEESTVEENAE